MSGSDSYYNVLKLGPTIDTPNRPNNVDDLVTVTIDTPNRPNMLVTFVEMSFHLSSVHANRFHYSGTVPAKKETNPRITTRDSPINLDFYARKTRKAG